MLWSDRQLEIEEKSRTLREQVYAQRQFFWPDREPRGLEVADPAIAAQVVGLDYQELEEIAFNVLPAERYETAGLLDRRKGRIYVATKYGLEVKRFTGAHELGHVVLHEDEKRFDFHRDLPILGLERTVRDPLEKEADHFAGCFLMPRRYVAEQFRARFRCNGQFVFDDNTAYMLRPYNVASLLYPRRPLQREIVLASAKSFDGRHFDSLAQLFKVSIETMAIRIKELGLVRR
jgi:Zn-dependent peptidase ImmA (M78 family)